MKKAKILLYIGCLLVLIAIIFVIFALNHPEMSFPWSNSVSFAIYGIYIVVTICVFVLSVVLKKK